jgi:hypothetical protein
MIFWGIWSLQDPLSVTLEEIIYFHDYLMIVIIIIMLAVRYFLMFALFTKSYSSRIIADHLVERV